MKQIVPLVVLVIGLAAGTAAVLALVDSGPFERGVTGNEQVYWETALRLKGGDVDNQTAAGLRSPLYPRLLTPFASEEPGGIRAARRSLTMLSLPLLGLLAAALVWRRVAPWPAVATGILTPICGALVLQAGSFSPAVPAGLLLALALLLADGKVPVATWLASGLLLGIVFRLEPGLAWGALVLLALMLLLGRTRPRRFVALGLLVAGTLAASFTTGTVVGERNLLPGFSGTEIYYGHRAEAVGVAPRRVDGDAVRFWSARDFQIEASRRNEARMTLEETDAYWGKQGLTEALRAPHRELLRTGVKLYASLQADPVPRDVSAAFLANMAEKPGLGITLWIGRIVLPLGLAGLLLSRRKVGALLWVGLLSAPAAAFITYASPVNRVATLLVLGAGVAFLIESLRGRRVVPAVVAAVAGIAVLGVLPGLGALPGSDVRADDHFQLGSLFDREGRGSAAMREYDRALRLLPDYPYPRIAVAAMLARDQVTEEAIRELEAVRSSHPRLLAPLMGLSQLYTDLKRFGEAIRVNEAMVQLDPHNPDPLNNLGVTYVMGGMFAQAEQAFRAALAVDPEFDAARRNLEGMQEQGLVVTGGETITAPETSFDASRKVLALLQGGLPDSARTVLEEAYARFGVEDQGLRFTDGTVRLFTGDPAGALEMFEPLAGVRRDVFFLNNLAVAYAQTGQLEQARDIWESLLKENPTNEVVRQSLNQVRAQIAARDSAAGN